VEELTSFQSDALTDDSGCGEVWHRVQCGFGSGRVLVLVRGELGGEAKDTRVERRGSTADM